LVSQIALSLLVGFAFMLILEQYLTPHAISPTPSRSQPVFEMSPVATDHEDAELNLDADITLPTIRDIGIRPKPAGFPVQVVANPLTLGLVIHSLADGLALGASASGEHSSDTSVSLVVFIALIIHKCLPSEVLSLLLCLHETYIFAAPTSLALTTSLLSSSLSRSDIKKHVAVFSAATPVGAVISFVLLNFIGAHVGNWTGVALLISVSCR
jgi:solute carrier family 39 (zinc transporter), member 9